MVSKYNPLTLNMPTLNYTYKVEKPVLTEMLNKVSIMPESEIHKFLKKHGNFTKSLYYAPVVGENFVFHSSYYNASLYFKHTEYDTFNGPSTVIDPVRRLCGLFWTQEYVQKENSKSNSNFYGNIAYFSSVVDEEKIPMKVNFTSFKKTSQDSLESEEWIFLGTNKSKLSKSSEYFSLIDENVQRTVYEDFTFSMPKFYQKSDMNTDHDGVLSNFADIRGDYNYFDRDYETRVFGSFVHEATLPNMYVFFAYQEQPSDAQNPAYEKLLTLDGRLNINNYQDMFASDKKESSQIRATPTEKYFKNWSKAWSNVNSSEQMLDLVRKYENIHFSAEDAKRIQSYGGRKELFPMWMDIQFTTDRIVEFAETLKDSQIMALLQSALMESIRDGTLESEKALTVTTEKFNPNRPTEAEENGFGKQIPDAGANVSYFDMSAWMDEFISSGSFSTDAMYATFLGTMDESARITNEPKYNFFKSLMSIILRGKIRKLLRKHTRSIRDIFSGKQCYNETLMYRIEKHDGDNSNGLPLQTVYVPNTQDLDVFQYIDTQVKYGKRYTYVIYAYQIVVGNKYRYIDYEFRNDTGGWGSMLVRNEPSLRIYESEIYRKTNTVIDNPPVSPEVEFVPYKGVNDKIKIIMNSGVGRYTLPYEVIESIEQTQYNEIKKAQNRDTLDTHLTFETDDYPAFYEIRRMTTKPKSYKDFAGKIIQNISTSKEELIASGLGHDDIIKPNTKYYYCIRAVDNHGHVSYPSPVYEVEMVDDKGSVYPIIRVVEFDKKVDYQNTIGAKRYIRITPAPQQIMLNEEASGLFGAESVYHLDDVVLGVADESVWDKKFKIRLVSKSTGRKIDFNIKFTHEHDKLSEDI